MSQQTYYLTNLAFAAEAMPEGSGGVVLQIEMPRQQLEAALKAEADSDNLLLACCVVMTTQAAESIVISLGKAVSCAHRNAATRVLISDGIRDYLEGQPDPKFLQNPWTLTDGPDPRD